MRKAGNRNAPQRRISGYCKLNDHVTDIIVDSGADISVMNYETFQKCNAKISQTKYERLIYGAEEKPLAISATVEADLG